MEGARLDSGADRTTGWHAAGFALVLAGAAAAVALAVVGVHLLGDINGPECRGEFPVCTTPTQHSVRQTFAMFCGVGVFAYLVAALPAARARRFNWAHMILALVVVLAVVAVVTDPVSHLSSEAGGDQWFVASWPL